MPVGVAQAAAALALHPGLASVGAARALDMREYVPRQVLVPRVALREARVPNPMEMEHWV